MEAFYYADSDTEVQLGDVIECTIHPWGRRSGRVIYIPHVSPPYTRMQLKGRFWIGLDLMDGVVVAASIDKDFFVEKRVQFMGRDNSPVVGLTANQRLVVRYQDGVFDVRLGDYVRVRAYLFLKRTGQVHYVPGISHEIREMEHDGMTWVGVRCKDMLVSTPVDPQTFVLKNYVRFLRRGVLEHDDCFSAHADLGKKTVDQELQNNTEAYYHGSNIQVQPGDDIQISRWHGKVTARVISIFRPVNKRKGVGQESPRVQIEYPDGDHATLKASESTFQLGKDINLMRRNLQPPK